MSDDDRTQVIQVKNKNKFQNFNSKLASQFNLSRTQRCTQQYSSLLSRNKSISPKSKKETSEEIANFIINLEKDENLLEQKDESHKSNKNEIKHYCSNCQAPLEIFSHPESHIQKCNIDIFTLPDCTLKDSCFARNSDHYKSYGHQWLADFRKGKFSNNPHYFHQREQNEKNKKCMIIGKTHYNSMESYLLNSNLERATEILSDENKTSNIIPKKMIDENTLLNENSKVGIIQKAPQAYSTTKIRRSSTIIISDDDSNDSTNCSKILINITKKLEKLKKRPIPQETSNINNDLRDNNVLHNKIVSNQTGNSHVSDNRVENKIQNLNEERDVPQASSINKTSRTSTVIILDEDSKDSSSASTNCSKTLYNFPKFSKKLENKTLPQEPSKIKANLSDNNVLQKKIISNQTENSYDSDNGIENEITSLSEERDVAQASSINKTSRTSTLNENSRDSTTSSRTLINLPKCSEKLENKNLPKKSINRENDIQDNDLLNQNKISSTCSDNETEFEIKSVNSNKRINKSSQYKKSNKKLSIYSKRTQSDSPNFKNQTSKINNIINDFASTQSIEYQPQNQTPSRVTSTKSNCLSNRDELAVIDSDIENDYFKKIIIDCKSDECQACINININRTKEMEKEVELFANLTKFGWENVSLECTVKDKGFQSIILEICKCKFMLNFIIILQPKPAPIKWNFKINNLNSISESDKNLLDCAHKESEQIKINEIKSTKQLEDACKNNKNQPFTEKLLKRKLISSRLSSSQSDDNNYHPSPSLLINLKQIEEIIEEISSNQSKETTSKNTSKDSSLVISESESLDEFIDTKNSKKKCFNLKNSNPIKSHKKENSRLNAKSKNYGIEGKKLKYISLLNTSLKIKLASDWINEANCMIKDFSFDAFKHKTAKAFFLTHYNIKILDDLNIRFFNRIIYCSELTADLLYSQYHIPKNKVKPLALGESFNIFDKKVTLLDSNFCQGSVMFLVESKNENSYLYSGPCQINFMMEMNPEFWNIKNNFDLYIDTRHYDNRNVVKDVSQVINMITNQVKIKETLIVINILPLCGISLWSTLADSLKCKVWAFRFYRLSLKDENLLSKLTLESSLAQLHIISESQTSIHYLNKYLNKFKKFSSLLILEIENPKYELITLNSRIRLLKLPYTEHSNYEDIQRFYKFLSPENCYALAYNDKIPN